VIYLNNNFHKIFLRDDIFAIDDLLENAWKNGFLVHFQIHAIQLTQPNQICAYQDTKFATLHLTFLAVPRMTLMLESDPKLVHFDKVGQNE